VKIADILLSNNNLFKLYLRCLGASGKPKGRPKNTLNNTALKCKAEYKEALKTVKNLGLPRHNDMPKNWDGIASLEQILNNTNKDSMILDAGAEYYSMILPWLFLYGYHNMIGINSDFKKQVMRGNINYEPGDITHTRFENSLFDAITCMSVIEHNVNIEDFFKEMSRILKYNGTLIISTDYYETSTNTENIQLLSLPWHIFNKSEVQDMINIAAKYGLILTSDIDYECKDRCINAKGYKFDINYTFIVFFLRKTCNE
jgi:SAM-dependent methyltransferase